MAIDPRTALTGPPRPVNPGLWRNPETGLIIRNERPMPGFIPIDPTTGEDLGPAYSPIAQNPGLWRNPETGLIIRNERPMPGFTPIDPNTGEDVGPIYNPAVPTPPNLPFQPPPKTGGPDLNLRERFNYIPNTTGDPYANLFERNEQFAWGKTAGAKDLLANYVKNLGQRGWKPEEILAQTRGYADTFASQFRDKVGRDPTPDEYNLFFQTLLVRSEPWMKPLDPGIFGSQVEGLIYQHFQRAMEEQNRLDLEKESKEAVAPGSAFDVWQKGYSDSLTEVEKSLQDYQTRLFEKLRPQLLISLQSQGLLNTGALNESFAGAAKDLAEGTQGYMANARAGISQDIANQKYGLMSAPRDYKLNTTLNRGPQLMESGRTALNNVFQNSSNLISLDRQFDYNRRLNEGQEQPSFLKQYAGQIIGGTLGGFASGYGRGLGSRAYPNNPAQRKVIKA